MYKRGTSNIGNFSLQEWEDRYALTEPLPPLAIPATLHDSLMARLDRLATVKALAQLGATLGREFSYALLRAVSPWDEETLQQVLQQWVEAEFLYLAQELAHPHSLAFTLDLAAWLHQFRREGQVAQERAEAALSLGTDQGFALWVAAGTIWRGGALAEQGLVEAGISQMRQGLDAWRATGAVVMQKKQKLVFVML